MKDIQYAKITITVLLALLAAFLLGAILIKGFYPVEEPIDMDGYESRITLMESKVVDGIRVRIIKIDKEREFVVVGWNAITPLKNK